MTFFIIVAIVNIVVFFVQLFFPSFVKKIGENFADILQNREKEYEAEKGRNLATKEDIAEITQKIEQVKSEVSFVNQWKHEHIIQREKRLIDILRKAEIINHAIDEIILLAHNSNRYEKLYELIDKLNTLIVEIISDADMIIVDYSKIKDIDVVTRLVDASVLYVKELSSQAHNIANCLCVAERVETLIQDGKNINLTIEHVNEARQKAKDLALEKLKCKKSMQDAILQYILWLKKLNDVDALSYYNIKESLINKSCANQE
jgi:hypothetical protein